MADCCDANLDLSDKAFCDQCRLWKIKDHMYSMSTCLDCYIKSVEGDD